MKYGARILRLDPRNAEQASYLISQLSKKPSGFTKWRELCADGCGSCTQCWSTRAAVASELLQRAARVWQVTGEDSLDPVGILRLSRIAPGERANLDFAFFDERMSDKVGLVQELIGNAFGEQDEWEPLKEIRAEAPAHAHHYIRTLIKLGFGGRYRVRNGSSRFDADAIIPTVSENVGDLVLMRREADSAGRAA